MEYVTRACSVYCTGNILKTIQLSGLYNDSKQFVDMPMKYDPELIKGRFLIMDSKNLTELQIFIKHNFENSSYGYSDWIPDDYIEHPSFLNSISYMPYRLWAQVLNGLWISLGRKLDSSVYERPEQFSFTKKKYPFIVPGGRFLENYYWDSWWIVRGLLICDMHETALNIISNYFDDIANFGFVPNGGRIYYLDRSQPPVLSEMIMSYFEYMHRKVGMTDSLRLFLETALAHLKIEYNWWMGENGRKVSIGGATLNRYFSSDTTPRPEAYKADYELLLSTLKADEVVPDTSELYRNLRAGAESGWDFSSRWIRPALDPESGLRQFKLANIATSEIVPIDLNSIMYRFETNMVKICETLMTDTEKDYFSRKMTGIHTPELVSDAIHFSNAAKARKQAINSLLWDHEFQTWRDYNISSGTLVTTVLTISSWLPMWAGLLDPFNEPSGAQLSTSASGHRAVSVLSSLLKSGLVQEGGVLTTNKRTGQQWDSPNAWAPLVLLTVEGLRALGIREGFDLAV